MQSPVVLEPKDSELIYTPEGRSSTTGTEHGDHSSPPSVVNVIAMVIGNLQVTINVKTKPNTNGYETENGESWSSAEELDSERPQLDIKAREQARPKYFLRYIPISVEKSCADKGCN